MVQPTSVTRALEAAGIFLGRLAHINYYVQGNLSWPNPMDKMTQESRFKNGSLPLEC